MSDLRLTVVTPRKKLVTDLPVENILVPGFRGELDILEGHAPLVTALSTGVLQYNDGGKMKKVAISWGYMEVYDNNVNILAETAETPEEIDLQRAHITLKTAETEVTSAEGDYLEKYKRKIERSKLRIQVGEEAKPQ